MAEYDRQIKDSLGNLIYPKTRMSAIIDYDPGGGTHNSLTGLQGGMIDQYYHLTLAELTKLGGIAVGAEVNVNPDWNALSGDGQILNKPTTLAGYGITDAAPNSHIGSGGSSHAQVTTLVDGFMIAADKTKLNGIAAGAEVNINPDWNAVSGDGQILNKPTTLAGYGITDGQPIDADLTAIAALAGTSGFLKKTAANTWTLDTSVYALSSHDHAGIYVPIAHAGAGGSAHAQVTTLVDGFMIASDKTKLNGIAAGAEVNVNPDWSAGSGDGQILNKPTTLGGYGITDAQALDADLTAIAALAGTSGFLKKTAANTWTLDTSAYSLTSHDHAALYAPIAHVGAGGTAHADVTTSVDGFMIAADKVKLNGIEAGATADMTAAEIIALIKATMLNEQYPVGTVYTNTVNVNPGTFLGGTWARIAQGRTLIGQFDSDVRFDTAKETGGAYNHVHTTAAHNHGLSAGFAMIQLNASATLYLGYKSASWTADVYYTDFATRSSATGDVNTVGSKLGGTTDNNTSPANTGSADNIMPYLVVYFWERTA